MSENPDVKKLMLKGSIHFREKENLAKDDKKEGEGEGAKEAGEGAKEADEKKSTSSKTEIEVSANNDVWLDLTKDRPTLVAELKKQREGSSTAESKGGDSSSSKEEAIVEYNNNFGGKKSKRRRKSNKRRTRKNKK